MKKVIAAMIGIAFAFCCFMLFTGCMKAKANEVYYPTYEEVVERDMLDSDFGHDYDSYVIIEEPNEENDGENDGKIRYIAYDVEDEALTMASVYYDWAMYYYFN